MIRRILYAATLAGLVASITFAAAATLNVDAGALGAGGAEVEACDANGVTVDYTVTFNTADELFEVTHVTVNEIAAPACNDASVQVAILAGRSTETVEGVARGGTTGALALDSPLPAGEVREAQVAISD